MKAIVVINRRAGFIQICGSEQARLEPMPHRSKRAPELKGCQCFGALVKQHKRRWPLVKMVPR